MPQHITNATAVPVGTRSTKIVSQQENCLNKKLSTPVEQPFVVPCLQGGYDTSQQEFIIALQLIWTSFAKSSVLFDPQLIADSSCTHQRGTCNTYLHNTILLFSLKPDLDQSPGSQWSCYTQCISLLLLLRVTVLFCSAEPNFPHKIVIQFKWNSIWQDELSRTVTEQHRRPQLFETQKKKRLSKKMVHVMSAQQGVHL